MCVLQVHGERRGPLLDDENANSLMAVSADCTLTMPRAPPPTVHLTARSPSPPPVHSPPPPLPPPSPPPYAYDDEPRPLSYDSDSEASDAGGWSSSATTLAPHAPPPQTGLDELLGFDSTLLARAPPPPPDAPSDAATRAILYETFRKSLAHGLLIVLVGGTALFAFSRMISDTLRRARADGAVVADGRAPGEGLDTADDVERRAASRAPRSGARRATTTVTTGKCGALQFVPASQSRYGQVPQSAQTRRSRD
jgi:hypothetical protein